ncbi:hypothetical protein V8C37DRAFT_315231 [Trichoderma ceciliae]
MDQTQLKIIGDNPIGKGLDAFRALFKSVCEDQGVVCSPDAIDRLDQDSIRTLAFQLFLALQSLRATGLLRPAGRGKYLLDDIFRLTPTVHSGGFDLDRIKPLFRAILHDDSPEDVLVWSQVYNAVTETTPPPQPRELYVAETPWTRNTSSIINSLEFRREVDRVLKTELGNPRVGIRNFRQCFFKSVPGLETAAAAVFRECSEGDEPLFNQDGWDGWPTGAQESAVLAWFGNIIPKLEAFAAIYRPSNLIHGRKLLAQPSTPLAGSTGRRSLDLGFVNDDFTYQAHLGRAGRYRWSHVMVPGELKSNPAADTPAVAWIDLATYAREVLSAQDTRRFVLAFTLCGSNMRLWEYDRVGGMASEQFNINEPKGGLEFVASVLGFLWIDKEGLGFDPTIMTSNGQRFIEIERDGRPERLIIEKVLARSRCIAGRATTCWKAHCEDDPQTPFVIKDSWQYLERDEEGKLLKEATEKSVINVARYYYHETVRIRGVDDEIRTSVRRGLDMATATTVTTATTATTAITRRTSASAASTTSATAPIAATATSANRRKSPTAQQRRRSSRLMQLQQSHSKSGSKSGSNTGGIIGTRRRSSEANEANPRPTKRPRPEHPDGSSPETPPNRVHRRIVLQDYGRPIYTATSPAALVAAVESCIRGHESLRQAGLLHRDVSINNILIDEDGPPSRKGFLIDLDLAIREQRLQASGAKGKTGTRAFMAIGVLFDERHSFTHDLESFFWVLFWICVHYDGPDKCVKKSEFDHWNYWGDYDLAGSKLGVICKAPLFYKRAKESFTPFYEPLIPLMDSLRAVVFPNGQWRGQADEGLYSAMKEILSDGMK